MSTVLVDQLLKLSCNLAGEGESQHVDQLRSTSAQWSQMLIGPALA